MLMDTPRISIVIPFYNEAESIPELLDELDKACAKLEGPLEWLLINDGSTDQTQTVLISTRATRSLLSRFRSSSCAEIT